MTWLPKISQQQNIVYVYALVGNIALAAMQTLIKQASKTLTPFQILYFRSLFLIFISLYSLKQSNHSPYIMKSRSQSFRTVLVRMVCMCWSAVTMMYCLKYLPVSTTTTLYNIGPIFIFFIQAIYFKKPLNKISLSLTVFSFIGVILIVQPEFLFGTHSAQPYKQQNFQFYITLMLFAAVGYAFNMLLIHILAVDKVPPSVNLHQSNLGFMLSSSLLCSFHPNKLEAADITFTLILQVLGVVLMGYITQYFIIKANSLTKPSYVMPFGYVSIVGGFIADVFLFKTNFEFLPVIGTILTSTGLLGQYLMNSNTKQTNNFSPKNKPDERTQPNRDPLAINIQNNHSNK